MAASLVLLLLVMAVPALAAYGFLLLHSRTSKESRREPSVSSEPSQSSDSTASTRTEPLSKRLLPAVPWLFLFLFMTIALVYFVRASDAMVKIAGRGTTSTLISSPGAPQADYPVTTVGYDTLPPSATLPVEVPFPGLGWTVLSAILFLGGAILVILYNDWRKPVGLILCIGSLTGLTIKEITLLRVKLNPEFAFNIERRFRYREIGRIGPFAVAHHDSLADVSARARLDLAVDSVRHYLERNSLSLVFVTGGADKRQLMNAPQTNFGSNEGLAKARALWVIDRIQSAFGPQSGTLPLIPLVDGSNQFGPSVTLEEMVDDRYVKLMALVHSTEWRK